MKITERFQRKVKKSQAGGRQQQQVQIYKEVQLVGRTYAVCCARVIGVGDRSGRQLHVNADSTALTELINSSERVINHTATYYSAMWPATTR
jgi:hypothetical protein